MMKKILRYMKGVFGEKNGKELTRKEKWWARSQIEKMAKVGGRLVLM